MLHATGQILGYVATAVASASLGFVAGGMLAFSKVADLYARLDSIENFVQSQSITIQHLSDVLKNLLREHEAVNSARGVASSEAVIAARNALGVILS